MQPNKTSVSDRDAYDWSNYEFDDSFLGNINDTFSSFVTKMV